MSFFGFEQSDLEKEKQNFLEGGFRESEDVAVYTWGEESYDGLGDTLQEGGDELNDETFGGTGAVGKDFDFSGAAALPATELLTRKQENGKFAPVNSSFHNELDPIIASSHSRSYRQQEPSVESLWNEKSETSVFGGRLNGVSREQTPNFSSKFSTFPRESAKHQEQQSLSHGIDQTGARTLQEIEEEMRVAAQQSRMSLQQRQVQHQQQLQLQQQQLQLQQEQQRLQQQLRLRKEQELLQQQFQAQQRTPPPRMLPRTQSPLLHQHQQQILMLQQQQEQQQQQRLQELEERLRMEELERRMRAQRISQTSRTHQRQPSGPTIADIQAAQLLQQHRRQSPAVNDPLYSVPLQQGLQYLPQSIQLQQRLLSEMAQAEFMRDVQGMSQQETETLRMEAMRKIMEAERMEEKRRRKASKIAHMSRYNDLMTQSDKDFITRIQVSQLVTQDPYAEDFYAQVYGAILRSRLGLQSQDERVLKFGSSGGVGLGLVQRGGNRRPNAMQRMEQQVERIVQNARLREKEKGLHSLHSLQGALGKTSGRSYKAAPRQLLQVDPGAAGGSPTLGHAHAQPAKGDEAKAESAHEGAAKEAAKLGREALGNAADTDGLVRKEPLTDRQVLVILEHLYDLVLNIEQLRRDQPSPEDIEAMAEWEHDYNEQASQLWEGLRVMVPLETSDPHPFISLLTPTKGKKILPRIARHLSSQQMLTLLTLLVACFSQLDVVRQAPLLDSPEETQERDNLERQTHAFLGSVLQSILPVVAKASLRLVSGLLGLLLDRSDIIAAAQSRPGLALLTLFLSRVEVIKQSIGITSDASEISSPEEARQWQLMFDHLFQLLAPHLMYLFPSTHLAATISQSGPMKNTDVVDQPVWQFLAALALHASSEQQQILVTALREKVLDNVVSANKGWVTDEDERRNKLANVNLFLHALGLDSSQIAL